MDAREREYKMALAARLAYEEWSMTRRWDTSENAMVAGPMPWYTVSQAAVRAAYEIDGVDELVEAISKLETAWGESWGTNGRDAMHDVFDAASRVREAMGGGA